MDNKIKALLKGKMMEEPLAKWRTESGQVNKTNDPQVIQRMAHFRKLEEIEWIIRPSQEFFDVQVLTQNHPK